MNWNVLVFEKGQLKKSTLLLIIAFIPLCRNKYELITHKKLRLKIEASGYYGRRENKWTHIQWSQQAVAHEFFKSTRQSATPWGHQYQLCKIILLFIYMCIMRRRPVRLPFRVFQETLLGLKLYFSHVSFFQTFLQWVWRGGNKYAVPLNVQFLEITEYICSPTCCVNIDAEFFNNPEVLTKESTTKPLL